MRYAFVYPCKALKECENKWEECCFPVLHFQFKLNIVVFWIKFTNQMWNEKQHYNLWHSFVRKVQIDWNAVILLFNNTKTFWVFRWMNLKMPCFLFQIVVPTEKVPRKKIIFKCLCTLYIVIHNNIIWDKVFENRLSTIKLVIFGIYALGFLMEFSNI